MITLQDCIALCDLSEAEVLAIAEHEHIPEIAAAALGDYMPIPITPAIAQEIPVASMI